MFCFTFHIGKTVCVCLEWMTSANVIHFIGSLAGGVEAADWLRRFRSKLSSGWLLDEPLEWKSLTTHRPGPKWVGPDLKWVGPGPPGPNGSAAADSDTLPFICMHIWFPWVEKRSVTFPNKLHLEFPQMSWMSLYADQESISHFYVLQSIFSSTAGDCKVQGPILSVAAPQDKHCTRLRVTLTVLLISSVD